ncbi:MAG: ParB/RepB/Spo0J family partition protein [Gammaproteobacteria bacterium]|nr:ParB/RepB/Spo0J family partition protein [Gammaproteobacteria bacterium]NIR98833.1 ParB/RepB/Spo0J family partition protein [Gammaproteobacteria bacterium]
MASKKRGLGRGLDALLGSAASNAAHAAGAPAPEGELRELPVDLIQRGRYQPRSDIHAETLEELADSIRAQGVVQPIVVRPVSAGKYEIIAGERRWRAAQIAGLQEIPAVVREVPDRAAIAMALIENIQRENLNPMEEARALQRLIDEFEMTHQQAAAAVGRSRTAVTNLLRLLELGEDVKALVEKGVLDMGHARALLTLKGVAQSEAARKVAERGLSVRETEQLVRRLQQDPPRRPPAPKLDPNIRNLQDELAQKLGAGVRIQHTSSGKGKLVIQYNSLDELDGILDHLR